MRSVSRPARAIATSGSPVTTLAYQSEVNPDASACLACSTTLSTVEPPPVRPIRMRRSPSCYTVVQHRRTDPGDAMTQIAAVNPNIGVHLAGRRGTDLVHSDA